jgi:hypothetical protein
MRLNKNLDLVCLSNNITFDNRIQYVWAQKFIHFDFATNLFNKNMLNQPN